jgi:hypothetical protein
MVEAYKLGQAFLSSANSQKPHRKRAFPAISEFKKTKMAFESLFACACKLKTFEK